jgi:UDP-glucose-4-epimerase GalE
MQPVLVTGGAGFIGSHTCKALATEGFLPVAFDDLSRGHAEFVRWGPLVRGDILNAAQLDRAFEHYRPVAVIHFAALAYVGESVTRPLSYYRVNVAGLVNVLEAMIRHLTKTIVFSSSCATYGIPEKLPITESAPQHPINPYGRTKLACEQIVADACEAQHLRVAMLRYFNAAGADTQSGLVERHDPETHLIPLAIDAATGRGPPLKIFGSDYPELASVTSFMCAIWPPHTSRRFAIVQGGNSLLALNLGSGKAYSVRAVVDAVKRVTRLQVPVLVTKRRPGDPPILVADATLARRTIGFAPRFSDLDTIVATAWRSRIEQVHG